MVGQRGSMVAMGTEIELKFRIPASRLAAVRRAVATTTAVVEPLAAVYLDTPDQHLAAARMALRLRREGAQWVQTLKAEGASTLQRLEHNVPLPGSRRPALETHRHDGTEAGEALQRLLAGAGQPPLQARYATEVQRTRRLLRSGGATIELALDEGCITAGRRRLPMSELELELLAGPAQALLAVAGRWAQRFGLVLDVRSKSERGHRLAAGEAMGPPVPPPPAASGWSRLLRAVLANASQLAEGPAQPAHAVALQQGLGALVAHPQAHARPGLPKGLAALQAAAADAPDEDALRRLLQAPATQLVWLAALAAGLASGG